MNSLVELMSNVPPPFNMVVLIVLIMSIAGVCSSIAKQVRKYASHRQELDFKRDLLSQGLAVDEVEQVVRAKSTEASAV